MVVHIEDDGVASICDAVHNAEEIRDPLEELLERAKSDAGAPYEDGAIKLLRETRQRSRADYERTVEKLRGAKVRIGPLERLVREDSASVDEAESGSITWPVDESWPEAINGEQLLDDVARIIERYVVLPAHAAVAIALWVAFSHSLDLWQICPRRVSKRDNGPVRLFRQDEPPPR